MAFTVQDLIAGNQPLVTAFPDEPVPHALDLMFENEFSQLPVVSNENRPLGIVSNESILRVLKDHNYPLSEFRVIEATFDVRKYRLEDNLFDLLDELRRTYAVLVVDRDESLIGIVTAYDAAGYFRQQAEDMMFAEDIETTLKEYILAAHSSEDGLVNQSALDHTVRQIISQKARIGDVTKRVLMRYLSLQGDASPKFERTLFDEAFAPLDEDTPLFNELSLADYINLLIHPEQWPHYSPIFGRDHKLAFERLDNARKIRNDLAHFREISSKQRRQLRDCANWLGRLRAFAPTKPYIPLNNTIAESISDAEIVHMVEALRSNDSRYAPLALYLQGQPSEVKRLELAFGKIEEIMRDSLPPSARQHRSWWANDSVAHVQSQEWLNVDWRVGQVNLSEERVVFVRAKDREVAYIAFFSTLMSELRDAVSFPIRDTSAKGVHWHLVTGLPMSGRQLASLAFSFTRRKKFRVELYIDTGNDERNKQIFDCLWSYKDEIEHDLGELLSWERLEHRRASRIALYHDGAITDAEEELTNLYKWGTAKMVEFHRAIAEKANHCLTVY